MSAAGEHEIVVVGAGAAGLWAAWRAAAAGKRVLLVEKTPRTGTKILASGGTHCNLTTTLEPKPAAELFGPEGARFLATALRVLPPSAVRERFDELGVETVEAPLEKIFPKSGRARDVRDALEQAARASGVEIALDSPVKRVVPHAGAWRVELASGAAIDAARVVLACGGMSYAKSGTTGDGYAWLRELDLPVVEPVPALVPLTSPAAWVKQLSGIALQDVEVRLVDPRGRAAGKRRRPLLFTHRGVSGPAAMDLSTPVARAEQRQRVAFEPRVEIFQLEVDLVPELSRETLRALLIEGASRPGAPKWSRVLPVVIPQRVLERVGVQAGVGEDARVNAIDKERRHALVECLKALSIPIDGTTGFDHAEVTAGGLALTQVDAGTMRVKGREGLYVCGELLDLQGPIGGLNFQAAFATAELVGRDLGARG